MNSPYEVIKISENVYQINEANMDSIFLVIGTRKALLVDSGFGMGKLDKLVKEYTNLPIALVNTHCHPDHCQGNFMFDDVYISKHGKEVYEWQSELTTREGIYGMIMNLVNVDQFYSGRFLETKLPSAKYIGNGYVFDLGGITVEVIENQGHSVSDIALLIEEDEILLVGDSVMKMPIWLHLNDSANLDVYLSNLIKLKSLSNKFKRIYNSHTFDSLGVDTLESLIECTSKVINGELVGEVIDTDFGKGIRYEYGEVSIVAKY